MDFFLKNSQCTCSYTIRTSMSLLSSSPSCILHDFLLAWAVDNRTFKILKFNKSLDRNPDKLNTCIRPSVLTTKSPLFNFLHYKASFFGMRTITVQSKLQTRVANQLRVSIGSSSKWAVKFEYNRINELRPQSELKQ